MTEETDQTRTNGARFQFVRELGRGVVGAAYEVLDEANGEHVVLKIFLRSKPRNLDTFKLEFQALARLSHPGLARFFHLVDPKSDTNLAIQQRLGTSGLAFTQEFVDGTDLLTYLRSAPTPGEIDVLEKRRQETGEIPTTGDVPEAEDLEEVEDPHERATAEQKHPDDIESDEDGDPEQTAGESEEEPEGADADDAEVRSEPSDGSTATENHDEEQIDSTEVEPTTHEVSSRELTTDELVAITSEVSEAVFEDRDDAVAEAVLEEFVADEDGNRLELVMLRLERTLPQVVGALEHLHKFHKVHGNIRPTNILVARDGTVKLTDYGLVPRLDYAQKETSEVAIPLLQAPENLPYLAPEVEDELDPKADLYALGCVLFEAISGESPHEHMEWSTEGGHGQLQSPPLADYVKECPASWASLVDELLSRDPDERPSLGRINQVISGNDARPVMVPPTAVAQPTTFVGREEIVEELKSLALETVERRQMTLVQLEGETGIGKSTILKGVSHWLARRGWLVLSGRCYNREPIVYQGWHEITSQLAELLDTLPTGLQEELKEDRMAAGTIFPALSPVKLEGSPGRLSAINSLRRILLRISEQRPILLVFKDLQWASWDTASLLIDLFSETSSLRCMVVGTWQLDTERSRDHLLQTDVQLALLNIERVLVRGYGSEEAEGFAKATDSTLDAQSAKAALKRQTINPLLLRELRRDTKDLDSALEELLEEVEVEVPTAFELLRVVFRRRIDELGPRGRAILGIASVASGAVPRDILLAAVEAELASVVLPAEGTEKAIVKSFSELVDGRLLREVDDDGVFAYTAAQHPCRVAMLEELSERDYSRLCGRLADAIGMLSREQTSLRFEYELRAGRISKAMESAAEAAEQAEARFAYHRAAKLWRWVLEREEQLPEYSMLKPASELARVEHLAGQHAQAAELYDTWVGTVEDRHERAEIRLKQAGAWLQAGEAQKAIDSLGAGLGEFGLAYKTGFLQSIRDFPARLATFSTSYGTGPSSKMPSHDAASDEERTLAEIYFFAVDNNDYLVSSNGDHFEARLCKLAESSGDSLILGMARLKSAQLSVKRRGMANERTDEWLEHAHVFFDEAEDSGWSARAWVDEGWLRALVGDYGRALKAYDLAEEHARAARMSLAFDHRRLLAGRALSQLAIGRLDACESTVRRLLHIHRGDRLAAFIGYSALANAALLRGEIVRATQLVDAVGGTIKWAGAATARADFAALSARLRLAHGQPEVAIAELDLFSEARETSDLYDDPYAGTRLRIALGQALSAEAGRQRYLGIGRAEDTLARARKICSELESRSEHANRVIVGEIARLKARIFLLRDRPRKALKIIEEGIRELEDLQNPLEIAKCTEVRGFVLQSLERSEARNVIEQAREMYSHHGFAFPLILEGWPAPKAAAALKED